jgi:hypothetical protein
MKTLLLLAVLILVAGQLWAAEPIHFATHEIAPFPSGYQVAVADLNRDGKPDVVALSIATGRVAWFENPTWKQRLVAQVDAAIDLAIRDIDGDGKPEIALASGFYFSEPQRGGQIQLLLGPANLDEPWKALPVGADPVTHRLRWADLDGDGRPELVHAPILGPGSQGVVRPGPSHLWAFRVPAKLSDPWPIWKIDESLTVLHGLYVGDLDNDGRDEILTASFEGIFQLAWKGTGAQARWRKTQISAGFQPAHPRPGESRGSSEVVPIRIGTGPMGLAAIEPWHGNQVVIYSPDLMGKPWRRRVLDDTLSEGHALVVADFDGDGQDEMVVGWRGAGGGVRYYDPVDAEGTRFRKSDLVRGAGVQGIVAADLNQDGRLDLVVIGEPRYLAWLENKK